MTWQSLQFLGHRWYRAGHLREIEASSTPRDNVAPTCTRSARSTVQHTRALMHGTCVRCLCSSPLVCMLSVFNVVCWLRFCLAFAHCTPVRGCFSVAHLTCLSGAWESSWRRTLRGHDLKGHRVGSVRALCLASSTRTRCWVHTSTTLPLASSVSWVTHLWRPLFFCSSSVVLVPCETRRMLVVLQFARTTHDVHLSCQKLGHFASTVN